MIARFLEFSIKDWLILTTLLILLFCILEIRKLKKIIVKDIQKRLIPQLNCVLIFDADIEGNGLYLKNEGFFLARSIKVEDLNFIFDDLGFKVGVILKFEEVDSLNPQEKTKLKFKVFDKGQTFLTEITDRIIPHLITPSFKLKIFYTNIEGIKFCSLFTKKREKFYPEKTEALPAKAS